MFEHGSESICTKCPTIQEHHISRILDSLEQPYQQRVVVHIMGTYFYTWDFFLSDIGLVIQADGANGHGTRYSLTDDVLQCRIKYLKNILHIDVETKEEIRDIIGKALNSLDDS
tara:strand:+ start:742 stop:1083 length:342 start_codon:yes stop_codon:yes gene_type:complete